MLPSLAQLPIAPRSTETASDLRVSLLALARAKRPRAEREEVEATWKTAVKRLSNHIRAATTRPCDLPLLLMYTAKYDATECVADSRRAMAHFAADVYVHLRTTNGCDLSTIGLDLTEENLEITSWTAETQVRKGYNAILRAVAVLLARLAGRELFSFPTNPVSAYALTTTYACTVALAGGERRELAEPLGRQEARELVGLKSDGTKLARNVKSVMIPPTDENFDRALAVFDRQVRCANLRQ